MNTTPFENGQVVCLHGGGPEMTIVEAESFGVRCSWFDSAGLHCAVFPNPSVKLARPKPEPLLQEALARIDNEPKLREALKQVATLAVRGISRTDDQIADIVEQALL